MTEKLTKKQKMEYVRAHGLICPHCKGEYLLQVTESEEFTAGELKIGIKCSSCKAEWRDIYELVGIEEIK